MPEEAIKKRSIYAIQDPAEFEQALGYGPKDFLLGMEERGKAIEGVDEKAIPFEKVAESTAIPGKGMQMTVETIVELAKQMGTSFRDALVDLVNLSKIPQGKLTEDQKLRLAGAAFETTGTVVGPGVAQGKVANATLRSFYGDKIVNEAIKKGAKIESKLLKEGVIDRKVFNKLQAERKGTVSKIQGELKKYQSGGISKAEAKKSGITYDEQLGYMIERENMPSYREGMKGALESGKEVKLSEILDDPMVRQLFPEYYYKATVRFDPKIEGAVAGDVFDAAGRLLPKSKRKPTIVGTKGKTDEELMRTLMGHETHHTIESRMGWPSGGSAAEFMEVEYNKLMLERSAGKNKLSDRELFSKAIFNSKVKYKKLLGEWYARVAGDRVGLPDEWLATLPIKDPSQIPRKRTLIKRPESQVTTIKDMYPGASAEEIKFAAKAAHPDLLAMREARPNMKNMTYEAAKAKDLISDMTKREFNMIYKDKIEDLPFQQTRTEWAMKMSKEYPGLSENVFSEKVLKSSTRLSKRDQYLNTAREEGHIVAERRLSEGMNTKKARKQLSKSQKEMIESDAIGTGRELDFSKAVKSEMRRMKESMEKRGMKVKVAGYGRVGPNTESMRKLGKLIEGGQQLTEPKMTAFKSGGYGVQFKQTGLYTPQEARYIAQTILENKTKLPKESVKWAFEYIRGKKFKK